MHQLGSSPNLKQWLEGINVADSVPQPPTPKVIEAPDIHGLFRALLIGAAFCVLVITIKIAAAFLAPILMGLWVALLCMPIVRWLRRLGMPPLAATATPIVVLVGTIVIGGYLLIQWIDEFINDLPIYQQQIKEAFVELNANLESHGITVPDRNLESRINLEHLVSLVEAVVPSTVSAIVGIGMVMLIFIYTLAESDATKRRLTHALGPTNPNLARLREFVDVVGDAMIARAILGLAAATGDGILLLILGVPQAGLWVIISFICSFIPYIGYWLALIPPLIVALATQGFGTATIVFFGYWIINGFFDSIVGPKFQGTKLNLSPVLTMISVFFWGSMFGAIGGMMALPLTLGIKILLLDAFPESKWLSLAIESDYREPETETAKSP